MDDGIGTNEDGSLRSRRLSLVASEPTRRPLEVRSEPLRLMVLDHDRELVAALRARARRRGWECHVLDRPTTRRLLARMKIDVLVVDPVTIDGDASAWLALISSGLPELAVMVCTGPSTVKDRVRALELGVDDWLEKPAHPDEVIARVESAVRRRRRAESKADPSVSVAGELEIRPREQQAFVNGRSVELTQREFVVLRALAAEEGTVVERATVYLRVWGYTMVPGDRSVDVHVRKIRAKLARLSPEWSYIHTQFRIGYRFQPERNAG